MSVAGTHHFSIYLSLVILLPHHHNMVSDLKKKDKSFECSVPEI